MQSSVRARDIPDYAPVPIVGTYPTDNFLGKHDREHTKFVLGYKTSNLCTPPVLPQTQI